jgi:hypothetical protein
MACQETRWLRHFPKELIHHSEINAVIEKADGHPTRIVIAWQ